jgi:hypothetical protein
LLIVREMVSLVRPAKILLDQTGKKKISLIDHDELNPVLHKTGDEMDAACEPVELGYEEGRFLLTRASIVALS